MHIEEVIECFKARGWETYMDAPGYFYAAKSEDGPAVHVAGNTHYGYRVKKSMRLGFFPSYVTSCMHDIHSIVGEAAILIGHTEGQKAFNQITKKVKQ